MSYNTDFRSWRYVQKNQLLVERHGSVHYVAGTRIRRSERYEYMAELVRAAKTVRDERRQLRVCH